MSDAPPRALCAPDSDADPAHPEPAAGTLPEFTPVPRLCDRSNGWKPEVQRLFIEALAETGSVKSACARVGRAEVGAYALRRHPEAQEFRRAWQAALDIGMARIEDVAMDRALNGVAEPLHYHGEIFGERRVYNDRLLMFLLRSRAPDRFGGALSSRAAGPNAVDKMEIARLKQEWQAERDREDEERRAGSRDFVERIADTHVRWWSECGPRTRAAYVHFRRLERLESSWLDEAEDREEAIAEAEAQYAEVFADDARSLAEKLGEFCRIGDERTCPELDQDGDEAEWDDAH